ncbi:DNA polymerase III subunit alpha [candidate division KSB1 bacterium]|nr:DNA polymerase III subunit alpha [candidate division KSB1 bacterium]
MFVHLHVHSYYSFLRGVNSIEALCAAARALGMRSLALTETNGVYGLIWFLQVARDYEIVPLIGAEIITPQDRAVILAKNLAGYRNLSQLITARHLDGDDFSLSQQLKRRRENLVILSDSVPLLSELKKYSGPENLYVELQPGPRRKALLQFCKTSRLPPAATNGVMFIKPEEHRLHQLLRAIDLNTSFFRIPEHELASPNAWLKPPETMAAAFPDCPQALKNTERIAEECAFELDFGGLIFPEHRNNGSATASGTAFKILKQKCLTGILYRYGQLTAQISERLEYELKIIREKGFAGYFLVVEDIVRNSRRTCGRGSAAASLVAYSLGITHVDPVKYDLFFERFLNTGRKDPPDIDVDFAWDERDDILDYVFKKYGTQCAAMISNHVTLQGKASIREVAKVFGLPEYEINRVTKGLRGWDSREVSQIVREDPIFKDQKFSGDWEKILNLAESIHGIPRHLSVHCGGVVIAPAGLSNYVPMERAAKGVHVVQWEKDQAEDAGLIKIDLLGNRSLAVIRDALQAIDRNYGVKINYTKWNPLNDRKTRALIKQGDTMGVFYVESPAMRQLQRKAGTDDYEHLVIHSSIIRPAANPFIQEYLARLKGKPWKPLHPLLKDIMTESYGIMVYQEDVSKTGIALAGFDPAEADELRKTLSKKNNAKRLEDFRQRFYTGALKRNVDLPTINKIWAMILSFSGYSFCKPHSASYALVSYKSACLRAHYPAEFMAAVISNHGGYYSTLAYLSECRRMKLEILPLNINESQNQTTGINRTIRIGFMHLKGMTRSGTGALLIEREKHGPFHSFHDFLNRIDIDPGDILILIKAGAFDELEVDLKRPELAWQLKCWEGRRTQRKAFGLPMFEDAATPLPQIADYDTRTKVKHESEAFGFPITRHPLTLYRDPIARPRHIEAKDIHNYVGQIVSMVGWLVTGKLIATKHQELMEFYSFEDLTALYETTFFPKTYQRFCHLINHSQPFILKGRVEDNYGVATLNVLDVNVLR